MANRQDGQGRLQRRQQPLRPRLQNQAPPGVEAEVLADKLKHPKPPRGHPAGVGLGEAATWQRLLLPPPPIRPPLGDCSQQILPAEAGPE